jgi:hypothetical protein
MMHPVLYRSHRKRMIMLSSAWLVMTVLTSVIANAWLDGSAKSEMIPAKTVPARATLRSQPLPLSSPQLQVERVTITPSGFDPEEIIRPSGQVMLAIDNRSGLDEVWFRIERAGGERLIDVRVDRRTLDWRKKLDLPPGRYRLTEARHPDWLCLITIPE